MAPSLRIRKLDARAIVPAYQSEHASGLDLAACVPVDESVTIDPGRIVVIRCGFAMAIPPGFEAQVRPRSGLASKHGISMPNTPGTIDADYRGEVMVPLINLGREPFTVTHGLRIAQMVIALVAHARVEVVDVQVELEIAAGVADRHEHRLAEPALGHHAACDAQDLVVDRRDPGVLATGLRRLGRRIAGADLGQRDRRSDVVAVRVAPRGAQRAGLVPALLDDAFERGIWRRHGGAPYPICVV